MARKPPLRLLRQPRLQDRKAGAAGPSAFGRSTGQPMTTPEAATTAGRSDLWPKEPYKGLAFYGIEDRLLFSGRDRDVDVCIQRLASAETRILLLHGNTGCGKSSFLRAGLIPGLEERGFGYFFLRDAEGSPLFIRCGPDPLGRIAEHVFRFASAS